MTITPKFGQAQLSSQQTISKGVDRVVGTDPPCKELSSVEDVQSMFTTQKPKTRLLAHSITNPRSCNLEQSCGSPLKRSSTPTSCRSFLSNGFESTHKSIFGLCRRTRRATERERKPAHLSATFHDIVWSISPARCTAVTPACSPMVDDYSHDHQLCKNTTYGTPYTPID